MGERLYLGYLDDYWFGSIMSTVLLSSLVGIGILVLVAIAYGAHRIEMNKIENKRRAGIHKDRYRNLYFIVETLPNKALKGDLPKLLTRSMVLHLKEAIQLDNVSLDLKHHLEKASALHETVMKGGSLPSKVVGGSIGEQLKDVQRGIKSLKEFILQQHRAGFLSKTIATEYIKSLHDVNLTAMVEGLVSQAKHSMTEGNTSLSLRYYQLALSEINKSKSKADFPEQVSEISAQIKQIKADKKAKEDADEEINQKLANSISVNKDDDGSFEMKQIN